MHDPMMTCPIAPVHRSGPLPSGQQGSRRGLLDPPIGVSLEQEPPLFCHSASMPAALMMAPHFCDSAAWNFVSSSGVDDTGSVPVDS